jgi:hypothetical protein
MLNPFSSMRSISKIFELAIIFSLINTSTLFAQNTSLSWVNQFGGLGFDTGLALYSDSSGNVFAVGGFSDTTDFDPGPGILNLISNGDQDIFILKNDSVGNFAWVKNMGGTGLDQARDLTIDNNNNLISIGIFENTVDFDPNSGTMNLISNGSYDIFIQKLDVNGNLIWAKRIGGSSFDVPESIVTDIANNIYVTGDFSGTVDFDPGSGIVNKTANGGRDIFVLKLNSNGNFLWVNQIGGLGLDDGSSIAFDKVRPAIYTTGQFTGTTDFDPGLGTTILTSNGLRDIFIQKLDTAGNLIWVKQIGGIEDDEGNEITLDATGNIISTGFFERTVDFDPDTGTTFLTSNGSYDAYVLKLDTNGDFIWVKQIGGNGFIQGYSTATDYSKSIYTIGRFSSVVDFDPDTGSTFLTSNGPSDIFIQKLDSTGRFLWVNHIGGTGYDFGLDIALGTTGEIYSTGGFDAIVDFDPGTGTTNYTSNGARDIFIQKLIQSTMVDIEEHSSKQNIIAYPNPTNGNLTIQFDNKQKKITVRLISITGQTIQSNTYHNIMRLNMRINQPNGLYLVEVINDSKYKKVIRLIKN